MYNGLIKRDKKEVFGVLCNLSKDFDNFYNGNHVDDLPIICYHNPNMVEAEASVGFPTNGVYPVIIKDMPKCADDAFVIAHEIMHVIRTIKEQPLAIMATSPDYNRVRITNYPWQNQFD